MPSASCTHFRLQLAENFGATPFAFIRSQHPLIRSAKPPGRLAERAEWPSAVKPPPSRPPGRVVLFCSLLLAHWNTALSVSSSTTSVVAAAVVKRLPRSAFRQLACSEEVGCRKLHTGWRFALACYNCIYTYNIDLFCTHIAQLHPFSFTCVLTCM